jgi:hypothetical protein
MTVATTNRDASRILRATLLFELTRLRGLHWADPSDIDLLERIARLKAELAAVDHTGDGGAS